MRELVNVFERRGFIVTDSRTIASETGKNHSHVLRTIDNIIKRIDKHSNQTWIECYIESAYTDASGKANKEYLLTKKGFLLYVFSIEGYEQFKMAYIDRFEQMETALRERQSTDWLKTREKGKLIRREETDAIQLLIPYAESQGSKNALMFYTNYSKLVNKVVGVESGQREFLKHKDLMLIAIIEDIITHTILEEMRRGTYYKNIYQICKDKTRQFAKLTYITVA